MAQGQTFRIGFGYDIHRLVEGRELILGGIKIKHHLGLLGHSDADVLLHAISDALLGALALRDIGYHFPDTDPKYKGADSSRLLGEVVKMVHERGYEIANVDSTIIAEAPKLNPHIPAMQTHIAEVMGLEKGQVSIKATTNEKVDAAGKEEAIVAMATVLLYKL